MKRTLLQRKIKGFTLVELLATLAIMAIIAGALFPFIGKYTQEATDTTNYRSLKMLQDSVDRHLSLNPNTPTWVSAPAGANTNATNKTFLLTNHVNAMITDISAPGEYQTLRAISPSLTFSNVVAYAEGVAASNPVVYISRYRPKPNSDRWVRRDGVGIADSANPFFNGVNTNSSLSANDASAEY
jgi:type IV pilus assembly protein PilA